MRYFLALLGAFCTLGGISAVDITGAVTNFTNSGLAALNVTNNQFINATLAADKQVNASLSAWNTTLISNLTALTTKYAAYVAANLIDTSSITGLISTIMSTTVPSIAADPTLSTLFSTVSASAQQSAMQLIAFAASASANATACTTDFSQQCLTKYVTNLTSAGVNISRYSACLANETSRVSIIASNMSTYINLNLGVSASLFNLTNICYIPTVAQITSATTPPSMTCATTFVSGLSSKIMLQSPPLMIPSMSIMARVQRCATLTGADITDSLNAIATAYSNCLITGS